MPLHFPPFTIIETYVIHLYKSSFHSNFTSKIKELKICNESLENFIKIKKTTKKCSKLKKNSTYENYIINIYIC